MGILDAPAINRFLPGRSVLFNPTRLSRWYTRLADCRYRQAAIGVFGNSIAKGQYSNNATSTDEVTWRARGWVPQLRDLFALRYGAVGEGAIQLGDVRCSFANGQSVSSVGIVNQGRRLNSNTATVTVTTPACTDMKIYWYWQDNASCAPPSYTVDGGGSVTFTSAPSGTDLYPVETITGLANTTHTLVITGPSGGKIADMAGVGFFVATSSGVAVHRLHGSGGYVDTLFPSGQSAGSVRVRKLSMTSPAVDLGIINFGHNECSSTGQGLGYTPTSFANLINEFVDFQTNTNNGSALVILGTRRDPAGVSPTYTEDQYYDAAQAIVASNANCAVLDLRKLDPWSTYAAANTAGLMQDVVHPNRTGHSYLSKIVFEALAGA